MNGPLDVDPEKEDEARPGADQDQDANEFEARLNRLTRELPSGPIDYANI